MIPDLKLKQLGLQTDLPITGEFYEWRDPKRDATFWEATDNAFSLHNPIYSGIKYLRGRRYSGIQEPAYAVSFDPYDPKQYDLTGFELESRAFASAKTADEANSIKEIITQQRDIRNAVEKDGWRGFWLSMGAGTLSPENLLPVGAAVNSFRMGENILRGAYRVGRVGGLTTAAQEAELHLSQPTRTFKESGYAVAGATFLSGILGGLTGALAKPQFQGIARKLEGSDLNAEVPGGSVGAATAYMQPGDSLTKPAIQVGKTIKNADGEVIKNVDAFRRVKFGPGARMEFSPLSSVREWGRNIESTPSRTVANTDGKASPEAVENLIKLWDGNVGDALLKNSELYHEYRTGVADAGLGRRMVRGLTDIFQPNRNFMTKREFDEAVSNAMSRGDAHEIPQVQAAAKMWREKLYDPVLQAAQDANLLSKDFKFNKITADSYINRVYNIKKIMDLRHTSPDGEQGFEDILVNWLREGGSRQDEIDVLAKAAKDLEKELELKTTQFETEQQMLDWLKHQGISEEDLLDILPRKDRTKITKERAALNAVRDKITKLEASQERLKAMDEGELYNIAADITDHIVRAPGGTTTFSGRRAMGKAGPFHERALQIPDAMIEKFLVRDIEFLASKIRRHVIPEIELARKFDGDLEMKSWIDQVRAESRRNQQAAKNAKERKYWQDAESQAITDAQAMRDRLMNVYEMPKDPYGFIPRASLMLRQFAFLSHMGQMAVSSIPDIGKIVFSEGLGNFGRGMKAMIASPTAFRMRMAEKRGWGVGADMALHTRAASFAEIGDEYGHLSKFERGVKGATEKYGFITLMDAWNSSLKQIAGVVTEDRILDACYAWAKGTIKQGDIEKLAASGIDEFKAIEIAREVFGDAKVKGVGETVDGVRFSRVDKWKNQELARTFKQAVVRDVDNTIVTPGVGDKPLWTSKELGKHVVQFKSFGAATVRRTLQLGLQQRDMATLNGIMIMLALGGTTYSMKAAIGKREITTDPKQFMAEALDQSGIMGSIMEIPLMANRTLGGALFDANLSRYRTRPQLGALFGPGFGMAERFTGIMIGGLRGDVSEANVHAARRLLPYNNLFYLRWLFDHYENRVKEGL